MDAGVLGLAAQGGTGLAEQQQGVAGLALVEQAVDQLLQVQRPLGQRARLLQALGQAGELADEGTQAAEQLTTGAFQGVQRQVVTQQRIALAGQLRRRGEAQQQAIQALAPGEGVIGRQLQRGTVGAIATPAHAGLLQPIAQQRQVFVLDTGTAGDGGLLQPGEDFLGGKAALGQAEQAEKGLDQRCFRAQAAVGQAVGHIRCTFATREDGLDERRVAFDIRGQHHHLVRAQAGVGGETGQQLVMQDFHLAQRRVGDVQLQRAVVLTQRQALVRGAGAQAQDVLLQGVQQAVVGQFTVLRVDAVLLGDLSEQAVEEVAALFTQAGQQRMADIQIPLLRTRLRLTGQLAHIANLAPGLAARVEREDHHAGMPRQAFQHTQMMWWQRADAEHQQTLRQTGDGLGAVQARQQLVEQARAVRVAVLGQLAPEQRLPGLLGAQVAGLAALPGGQPVVAIEQVLVENVGDLRRQGQAPALVAAVQIALQALGAGQVGRLAQPVVEAPGHGLRIERGLLRQRAQHLAGQAPDEAGRQLHIEVHGDALLAGQLQGQPATDALARHHHPRRRQHVRLRLGE